MSGIKTDLQEQADDLAYFAKAIEHFETHDIGDELANSPEVHFEVSPQTRRKRYPLDYNLATLLDNIADQRGMSAEALLNEWVREKTAGRLALSLVCIILCLGILGRRCFTPCLPLAVAGCIWVSCGHGVSAAHWRQDFLHLSFASSALF